MRGVPHSRGAFLWWRLQNLAYYWICEHGEAIFRVNATLTEVCRVNNTWFTAGLIRTVDLELQRGFDYLPAPATAT